MVEATSDLNAGDQPKNRTALMYAAESGCKEVVELLLKGGADIEAKNIDGQTALMLAQEHKHPEIVALLQLTPEQRNKQPSPATPIPIPKRGECSSLASDEASRLDPTQPISLLTNRDNQNSLSAPQDNKPRLLQASQDMGSPTQQPTSDKRTATWPRARSAWAVGFLLSLLIPTALYYLVRKKGALTSGFQPSSAKAARAGTRPCRSKRHN